MQSNGVRVSRSPKGHFGLGSKRLCDLSVLLSVAAIRSVASILSSRPPSGSSNTSYRPTRRKLIYKSLKPSLAGKRRTASCKCFSLVIIISPQRTEDGLNPIEHAVLLRLKGSLMHIAALLWLCERYENVLIARSIIGGQC